MGRARNPCARRAEALEVRGLPAPVEVRRHPSARRMTLRVSRTQRAVIMTLPHQCDLQQADAFLNSHLDWVRERLGSIPEPQPFKDGAQIPFRGQAHRIRFIPNRRGRGVVTIGAGANGHPVLQVHGEAEHCARRLKDWLTAAARRDITDRVAWHATRLKLQPNRITIRDQVSRWGSCSSSGNLSFSWRLIMAPPDVLDYVAAHEVAHLAEMNHGPRFWELVRKTCPGMDEARAWLDLQGADLHRYDAK